MIRFFPSDPLLLFELTTDDTDGTDVHRKDIRDDLCRFRVIRGYTFEFTTDVTDSRGCCICGDPFLSL
jgi:hypothetical protein